MTPPDFVANHVPPPMQKSVRITLTEYTEIIFCLETLVFLVITVAGNNYSSNWEEKMLMVVKGRTQMFYKHSKIQKRLWQVSTFFCSKGCVKKPSVWIFILLISQFLYIGSLKFLFIPHLIYTILCGVGTRMLKMLCIEAER